MTLNQIVSAHAHINALSNLVLPYPTARRLVRLKKQLQEEFDTIVAMEKALAAKYGGTAKDGGYTFPSAKKRKEFSAEYDKEMTRDQKIELPTVDVSQFTGSLRISAASMEALDGLVIFEREANAPHITE